MPFGAVANFLNKPKNSAYRNVTKGSVTLPGFAFAQILPGEFNNKKRSNEMKSLVGTRSNNLSMVSLATSGGAQSAL